MKNSAHITNTIFTIIGVMVFAIWFALLIMGQLGIIGNLIFLGAAAWLFELYSASHRGGFRRRQPPRGEGMEGRLQELEEDHNL